MLLKALLETHAWANARVDIENNRAAERFEQKISGFMMIEKEQGMSSLSPSSSHSSLSGALGNSVHRVVSACKYAYRVLLFDRENARAVTRVYQ